MDTKSDRIRHLRAPTLLSVLVAANSILVATPAIAVKPLPTLDYVADTFQCHLGGTTGATFSVTGGKGRWAIVTTYVSVNGGVRSAVGLVGARVELGSRFTPDAPTEPGWTTVEWTAEVVDRQGDLQGESATSGSEACS